MTRKTRGTDDPKQDEPEGKLEKLARLVDPPGREITDAELSDPGANIRDDRANPPARKAPDTK